MSINKKILIVLGLALINTATWAGNKDRSGQPGAGELLINPWARSGGLFGLNCANTSGLEAMKINIAGMAQLEGTEIGLSHTRYLAGTGMGVSNVGFAQKVGGGVLGVNLMTFSFGEIPITTANSPQGGIGSYKPSFFNASVGYSYAFSKSMSAGLNMTFVNEAISNIRGSAVGFDAGIQYKSGVNDQFKLGIVIKNIGTNIRFTGDGFAISTDYLTLESRSDKFQLPSQLNIGASYDFYLDNGQPILDADGKATDKMTAPMHKLTGMFSFVSNAFAKDWLGLGAEYSYKEKFFLRAAFRHESDIIGDVAKSTTFYTGLAAGIGYAQNLGKDASTRMAFDYAYKPTRFSNGMHTLGIRMFLNQNESE